MEELTLFDHLSKLGFTSQDYLLVVLCPIFAALGSLVHAMLLEINPNKIPSGGALRSGNHAMAVLKWHISRLFIGAALGLILGLYFVGSLIESPNAVSRVLALAVLMGFSAPKLWLMQEKHILEQVEKKIEAAIGNASLNK